MFLKQFNQLGAFFKQGKNILILFIGVGISSQVFAQQAAEIMHEKILDNGLKVIVKEDHRSPTVAHMIWYKTGAIDENYGVTGVAHVLEHMMFKGTKNIASGEFSKKIAALGGRENAFTSSDYTAYFQQIEKSHLPEMMRLEADRMHLLNFTEAEFLKEIKVVMEERRLRTADKATGLLYEQFLATAFNSAPNRHPVVGWMSDLKNMTYQDAKDWYDRWYTPSNAVLVVVGDVNPQEVFSLAQKTYGQVPNKILPLRKVQSEPEQRGMRRFIVKAPAENVVVFMGWKVPKIINGDLGPIEPFALSVLSGILDGNQNTRLNRILVKQKRISSGVGASYDADARGEQLFFISGTLLAGKKPEMFESEVKKIISDIAKNGVQAAELERVKIAVTASQVYKRDSVFGQAMEIGSSEMSGLSWKKIDQVSEKILDVTAEQVQEVASKYFQDAQLTIGILDPQQMSKKNPLGSQPPFVVKH